MSNWLRRALPLWWDRLPSRFARTSQQPGQLRNQLHKSMRSGLIQLIKFSIP